MNYLLFFKIYRAVIFNSKSVDMKLSKIIGALLIAGSLLLGYMGFNTISESTAKVEILDVELKASDEGGKERGYIYVGVAVLLFFGGIYSLNKK